jgi:DHA1 family tetracycline resistance protein-like MFS transporter
MAAFFQRPGKAAFIFILITVALDMLALGVMVPVLPKLIIEFEGGDLQRASSMTGLFGFSWALMQFLFQPALGALSDRFGRRPVVLLSNLGLGLDYVFMALAPSLWLLFAGRLISGVTSASFSTASAYISDITPAEKRAGRFGMIGAAFGLGFILGPALGGVLGNYGLRLPFWVAAALSLLNALYGYFILPESLAKEQRTKTVVWRGANIVGTLDLLRRDKALTMLAAAVFLSYLAHESLPSLFVLYTEYRYHWDAATTGWALTIVGVSQTIVSGALVRPVVGRLGESRTVVVGLAFGALGFAVYALTSESYVFMAAAPLISLWAMANPAFQGIATRFAGASEQGRLQGALSSLRGISGMIGPLFFTQILATSIATQSFTGAAYFIAALLLAASLYVAMTVTQRSAPAE